MPPGKAPTLARLTAWLKNPAWLRRDRTQKAPWTAEECRRQIIRAGDEGRWAEGLDWVERARQIDPQTRYADEEAYFLLEAGDYHRALGCYDILSLTSTDGIACLYAAESAALAGKSPGEVLDRVEAALAKDPTMAYDLHVYDVFAELAGHPRYEKIVKNAMERVTSQEADGVA